MDLAQRQVLALGGGGFSMEAGNRLLDDYALEATGVTRPRVCFLPTASGDADHYIVRFYRAFGADRCEPSHVSLFRKERESENRDWREHLLSRDLIYVGGGSVISLLGVWRAHGIDQILREAWEQGTVLCGVSAGSLCWFDDIVTSFHGEASTTKGLGILPWSNCVHYQPDASADPFRALVRDAGRPGFAAEDGAALHFRGEELSAVVGSRPDARAFRMRSVGGRVVRTAMSVRYLGEQQEARVEAPLPARAADHARRRLASRPRVSAAATV
ncbi:MAG: peptidase E [Thermoleophilaceae bacterium]|nr:peptidase E [Thermoleophilaceae bacterium]